MKVIDEMWKEIPGLDGYDVSDRGAVRSWHLQGSRHGRGVVPRLLTACVDRRGYLKFNALVDRVQRCVRVHRAVLLAFVGEPPPGSDTRHLNGVRTDNRLENLRYGTRKENCADRVVHGTSPVGERNPKARLCYASVVAIRAEFAGGGVSQTELGRRYDVTQQSINDILARRSWKHVPAEAEVV